MTILITALLFNYLLLCTFLVCEKIELTTVEFILLIIPYSFLLIYTFCLFYIVIETIYFQMKKLF